MGFHRKVLVVLLVVAPAAALSCADDEPAIDDDDTIADPDPSPCATGFRLDPELPAESFGDFPDGCVPQECGIGRWGSLDVDGDTVFVDARAEEDGDGSEQAPFTDIQAGLDAAGGGMVAVAAGTYVENLDLTEDHDGVRLVGRCRELVVVDGSEGAAEESGIAAMASSSPETTWDVAGLTVTGAPYLGILLDSGHLTATALTVVANQWVGVLAHGSSSEMRLSDVDILDTRPEPGGTFGIGLTVQFGALVEASACRVSGNTWVGIHATDADVVLRGVEVLGTLYQENGTDSRGINAQDGARLWATACRISENAGIGISVSYDAEAFLQDVEVQATQPQGNGTGGKGIGVSQGGRLEAVSCLVSGNAEVGILATDDAEAVLHHVDVHDTLPGQDGGGGRGIEVSHGARLRASSCLISGNSEVGILAMYEAQAVLQDVEVRDTLPRPDGTDGWGIGVQDGARLEAVACRISGNSDTGIMAGHDGTEVVLQDVEIVDTRPEEDGTSGRGIGVQEGAHLRAASCLVSGNADVGIFTEGAGTDVILQDVEVRDTRSEDDGTGGRGISVQDGARLEAVSCSISGNADIGIFAVGERTEVVLQDVEVWDTMTEESGEGGTGICVQEGAHLDATSCLISGNADIGVIASEDGTEVVLQDVEVRDTRRTHSVTVAQGVVSQRWAELVASGLIVSGTEGPGLFVSTGTLTCSGCDLSDNTFAGVVGWAGGSIALSGTVISGTRPDANEGGGIGIYISDRFEPTSLTLEAVSIEDQPYAALWLDGDGSYSIANSTLAGGHGYELTYPDGTSNVLHGDGIVATGGISAWDGTQGLLLHGNEIHGAFRTGLLLDGSTAELVGNTFTNNGTDLTWQNCTGVQEPSGLDDIPVVDYCPVYNHHVAPLEFQLILKDIEPLDI